MRSLHGDRERAGHRSCVTAVKTVEGSEITTLEGIGTIEKPHPLQKAFIEEQAAQCGFCMNGVIMTAKAFLDTNPKASKEDIQQALSGVLCRCFTHTRMLGGHREGPAGDGAMKRACLKRQSRRSRGCRGQTIRGRARRGADARGAGSLARRRIFAPPILAGSGRAGGQLQHARHVVRRRAAQFEGGEVGPPHDQLDSWIAIGADGSVTAYTGKEELGQGISTAQIQLVAEELCVPFERVKLIYCDTSMTPDQGVTSGSQSHPTNFNHANLAQAGATARQALLQLASKRLNVPVEQLAAADGAVSVKGDATKKASYGELIGGKKFSIKLDGKAPRKPASEWTVLGKPAQRPDLPGLVTGQFEFVHNMRLPGMLHGRVVRPPAWARRWRSVDESSVAGMPGVVKVVVRKNFVGVVAEKPWQAVQAAQKLAVTWTPGAGLPKHADLYDFVRNNKPTRDTLVVNSKDVEQTLARAATVVKATYHYPYQMHGSMGASCAVADVQGERATIYSPTQAVWHQRSTSAMVLGLKPENVRVIFRRGSGCYGCNGADAVTFDAALLSQAVGKPVKVQFSRKDEMAWGENYGFAFVLDQRAGLDAEGNIIAWDHESWSPVLGNRPGHGHSRERRERHAGGVRDGAIRGAIAGSRTDGLQQRQ